MMPITTATLRVNNRTKIVQKEGNKFAREFARILGDETAKLAQANVAPGRGPGPHPHRPQSPHEDTGDLMESIKVREAQRGFMFEAFVTTDIDYGLYLEMGWTTKAGTHYRYPWLYPAAVEATRQWEPIARSTSARSFTDDSGASGAIDTPLSATWLPE